MNDEAREAKREYFRKYRKEHPDRVAAAQERYWTRKAAAMNRTASSTVPTGSGTQETGPAED